MTDPEKLERRIDMLEAKMQDLSDRINSLAVSQAATGATLDSMLITLGELKESVNGLSSRPLRFWDKFLLGLLGSIAAALGAALISLN